MQTLTAHFAGFTGTGLTGARGVLPASLLLLLLALLLLP